MAGQSAGDRGPVRRPVGELFWVMNAAIRRAASTGANLDAGPTNDRRPGIAVPALVLGTIRASVRYERVAGTGLVGCRARTNMDFRARRPCQASTSRAYSRACYTCFWRG